MSQINRNLLVASKAAVDAGKAIMKIYGDEFEVNFKEDKSPLTLADKRANAVIMSYLQELDIPIISEENKQIDYKVRNEWNTCWVVDPLDGTKEFIKRNGEFTVNIALVKNGKPTLGVIYVPVEKTLYIADTENSFAFKMKLDEHNIDEEIIESRAFKIEASDRTQKLIRVVGSRSHMSQETLDFIETLKKEYQQVEIVSKGSSLKFCLVAEGLADVYPRFAPTMEWDTAAGQAICNAVGINVICKATDKPLAYNKENLLNPWFIVG